MYAKRTDMRAVEEDPRMAKSKGVLLSRPKDESLEAFKAWILEMTKHLTGKSVDDGSRPKKIGLGVGKNFGLKLVK
jgi:hypothetical protein